MNISVCPKYRTMKNEIYKVAVIIPYFGKFPEWINLFLYSCSRNKVTQDGIGIDWLIFTDNDLPKMIYENTLFHQVSFSDYCRRISKILDIDFCPDTPYKLCDMKPFYGIIHREDLDGYSHWGFGDLDLCYGNLSMIVNKWMLKRYDLITTHADRVAGHFTIIRKSSIYNDLCLHISDWKNRLSAKNVFGLDEMDMTNLVRPMMVNWLRVYRHIIKPFGVSFYGFMDLTNVIHNLFFKSHIKEYYTTPPPKDGEIWTYKVKNNCIVSPIGKEIPYLHFLFFKKTPFWETPHYWKPGFYQIDNGLDGLEEKEVKFDNRKISF